MKRIFIDGSAGTTGLRIEQRLTQRAEFSLLRLDEDCRKELSARVEAANSADLVFLCLPDAAAREIVPLLRPEVRVCDTSTAHRTAPGWVYGFPELGGRREAVREARRVAVPGCHASGFLSLAAPLVETGLLARETPLTAFSLTGYSGGGKSMIAAYENTARKPAYEAPRAYGLTLAHKHLPEMQEVAGLAQPPLFCPVVADYYSGMCVSIPLFLRQLARGATAQTAAKALADYYDGETGITVHPLGTMPEDHFLAANTLAGSDNMELYVFANETQLWLASVFDNLGKGSSGAAVQCMNLMLGLPERAGLE